MLCNGEMLIWRTEFIVKLLPVSNLTAEFLLSQYQPIAEAIKEVDGGQIIAIVTDGHQVNQKLFRCLNASNDYPWQGCDSTFLLYDYVHLLKCIRNNWLTEKCGQLEFHQSEVGNLLRLSKLTYNAVFPTPIEKQNVVFCLQVFCDETIAALECFSHSQDLSAEGTILFLKLVVKFWKIVNVHCKGMDLRVNDERRAVISTKDDERLSFLIDFAAVVNEMKSRTRKRIRKLTIETETMLSHTCSALVNLAQHLLTSGNCYVLFGWFTTDPLEKYFSKLRQGSGGTYFINAQSVLEKVKIHHAKLALRLGVDFDLQSDQHSCLYCNKNLMPQELEVLDNLFSLEEQLSSDTLNAMVYIGGYLESKTPKNTEDTSHYYEKYGVYINHINRGRLTIPGDCTVQWIVYCFIFFATSRSEVCHSFLIEQFNFISEYFFCL